MESKLISLEEAIRRFVPDDSEIVLGTSLESLIPFAAGHELIRSRKRNLTLTGPISDILFDQIIGGGCVKKIRAAWVGNVITGSGYNFRRAVESGQIEVEDHSNLTICMALRAGAMGLPYLPTRTALGSDLFSTNPTLKITSCPFTGETLTAVKAVTPNTAIIHAQRSDEFGNAHLWGNLGITREACLAATNVIITTEEIVSPDIISSDPNRVVTPGFRVSAVVHAPWGAHPSPVPGYYNRDHQAFIDYRTESKSTESFGLWEKKWIMDVKGPEDYKALIGKKRMLSLKIKNHLYSEPVDYGY